MVFLVEFNELILMYSRYFSLHYRNPSWWRRRSALEKALTVVSIFALIAVIALVISLISVILNEKSRESKYINVLWFDRICCNININSHIDSGQLSKSNAQALESSPAVHLNSNSQSGNSKKNKSSNEVKGKDYEGICLTPGCIHTASHALDVMDTSVEPCDDFYTYACGNFVQNTMIPDEKVSVNTFSLIGDKLQEQLRALISEEPQPGESKPFTLAKDLYKACMNKSLIEERGLKPFKDISESLGGWPAVVGDRWDDESSWNWIQAVKDFRKIGYSMDYIFDFSIGIDLKESLKRIIDVSAIHLCVLCVYRVCRISRKFTYVFISGWSIGTRSQSRVLGKGYGR